MPRSVQSLDTTESADLEEGRAYAHTLSMRMSAEQYRRLRLFVVRYEDRTGRKITHQALMEKAVSEYLDRNGTPS